MKGKWDFVAILGFFNAWRQKPQAEAIIFICGTGKENLYKTIIDYIYTMVFVCPKLLPGL